MLCEKLIETERSGSAFEFVQRRIALAETYGIPEVVEDGEKLAKAPDSALVEELAGTAPFAPKPLQGAGIGPVKPLALSPSCIFHFEEVAALRAAEVGAGR
jgi:predicted flap endonuclease-1-like 5' DNA nuclease